MPSTYSNLKIQLMETGENSGTWGNVTNNNLGVAIEQALVETATVTFASANVTLSLTNTNAAQDARALRLNLTGTTGGARDLIVPAIQKPYIVNNGCADTVTVKVTGQTGIAVPAGRSYLLYNNGTDVVNAIEGMSVVSGGTGLETLTAESVVIGNGTNAVKFVAPGTSSNVLTSNGTAWVSQAAATTTNANAITTGILSAGVGGTGANTLTSENVIIGNGTSAVKFVAPGTTGNVLTSNGTAWLSQAAGGGGGGFSGSQGFSSPGIFTAPPTTNRVYVVLQAGGGGGGGRGVAPDSSVGAGGMGSGGGAAFAVVPVTGGSPYPVTVGAGGNATPGPNGPTGTGGAGGAGGASSFSNLVSANGGGGGNGSPGNVNGNAGAAGNGVAPTGTGIAGQAGQSQNNAPVGAGGSAFGQGGFTPNSGGKAATSGGGGAGSPTVPIASTAGAAGFVFVAY